MWTVHVWIHDGEAWVPIWAGDGRDAERDVRRRFAIVREAIEDGPGERENVHAEEWDAVRLARDGLVLEEYLGRERTVAERKTWEPPKGG